MTVEDVKYMLSGHYQGTPYDPYLSRDTGRRGVYRSIGINRTGVTTVCQIRPDVPESAKGVEWICFGSTAFSAQTPFYAHADRVPKYLSEVTLDVSTEDLYWSSRLLGALADSNFGACVQHVERYHSAVFTEGRKLLREYDAKIAASGDTVIAEANEALSAMVKKQTVKALNAVLYEVSQHMKNGYSRADN